MHRYSIDQLIGWFRDGILWWVLAIANLSRLVTIPQQPPDWWYAWWSFGDWYHGSDNGWHPYRELAEKFVLGVWRLLGEFISESANYITSNAVGVVRNMLGTLPQWAWTVAQGLDTLLDRVGRGGLTWASNAIDAANRLFEFLPGEITRAGLGWGALFNAAIGSVRAWVASNYDDARQRALSAFSWISNTGGQLVAWYNAQHDRVQTFLDNPRALIIAALGNDVLRAMVIAREIGDWLYSFKSLYSKDIGELFADPGAWIVKKIQAEVERIW